MEAIYLFEESLKLKKLSVHTVRAYVEDVKQWKNSGLPVKEYLNSLPIQQVSKQRKLNSINKYVSFMKRNGVDESFTHTVSVRKRHLPKFINKDIVKELKKIRTVSERDYIVCALLYETGMRLSEFLSLDPKLIKDCCVKITGKGNKQRIINISPDLCLDIQSCSDKIFNLSESAVANITKKWFGVSPHVLRHTFASHLVQRGANIKAVQDLLGHSSIKTTCIYANMDTQSLISEHRKRFS